MYQTNKPFLFIKIVQPEFIIFRQCMGIAFLQRQVQEAREMINSDLISNSEKHYLAGTENNFRNHIYKLKHEHILGLN